MCASGGGRRVVYYITIMMKALSVLLFVLFSLTAAAQFPITQNQGAPATLTKTRGGVQADSGFVFGPFVDTAAANGGFIKNIPGIVIRTVTPANTLWLRNSTATRWLALGFASSSVTEVGYRSGQYVDTFYYTKPDGSVDWYYNPIVNGLLSGGDVLRIGTSLNYSVALAVYRIGRTLYISPADTVAIAARDSLPRIDVFYADTNSLVGVLTGTPDSFPLKPSIDVASQVELGFVYVPSIGDTTGDLNVPNFVLFGMGNKINGEYQFAYDSSTNTVIITGDQDRFELNGDQWYHANSSGNLRTAFLKRGGSDLTTAGKTWRWGELTIRPSLRGGTYGTVVFGNDEVFESGIGFPALKHVGIYTDEVERLTVDSVGRVYIKTTPRDTTGFKLLTIDPNSGEIMQTDPVSNVDTCDAITSIGAITKATTTPYVCYNVPDVYFAINCTQYFAAADSVCIQPPSPDSLGRFDVIYADTLGNIGVIEGTVDSFPVIPTVDPLSQIFITAIYVQLGQDTAENLFVPNNVLYGKNGTGRIYGDPPFNYTDSIPIGGGQYRGQVGINAYPYTSNWINNNNTTIGLKVGNNVAVNGNVQIANGGVSFETSGWQKRQILDDYNAKTVSIIGGNLPRSWEAPTGTMNFGNDLNFVAIYDSMQRRPLVFTRNLNQFVFSVNSNRRAILIPRIASNRLANMKQFGNAVQDNLTGTLQEGMIAFDATNKNLVFSRDTGWVSIAGGSGQNFANADLTATGDRTHTFGEKALAIKFKYQPSLQPYNAQIYADYGAASIYTRNDAVGYDYLSGVESISGTDAFISSERYGLGQINKVATNVDGYKSGVSITASTNATDSIFVLSASNAYNRSTTSTAKYKVVLMDSTTGALVTTAPGNVGSGTVTTFSSGNLSPLFTTSVATATTTPSLSFSLNNAGAYTVFGNQTNASAAPSYGKLNINTIDATGTPSATTYLRGDGSWATVISGVTTVGAFSASSQTNGASISGSTITFGPADATNPGMVSTGAQTWAGAKTFNGIVNRSNGTQEEKYNLYNDGTFKVGLGLYAASGLFRYQFYAPSGWTYDFHNTTNGGLVTNVNTLPLFRVSNTSINSYLAYNQRSNNDSLGIVLRSASGGQVDFYTNGASNYSAMYWYDASRNLAAYISYADSSAGTYQNGLTVGTRTDDGSLRFVSKSNASINAVMTSDGIWGFSPNNGISDPTTNNSAIVSLNSTNRGFLPPRMTATQRTAISTPAAGLLTYDTDSSRYMIYNGSAWKGLAYSDQTGGSTGTLPYTAKTTTYTASSSDYTIDCTSGTFTINLPTAVGITGKVYVIKNSGSGIITIDPNGTETIDGQTTYGIIQYEVLRVQSNGANWITI